MSPSSGVIALGRQDGAVEMWTPGETGGWNALSMPSSPHDDEISWIDFDSQGAFMVSTSRDGVAVVWDTSTGQRAGRQRTFPGSPSSVSFFEPDAASKLVTIDANGRVLDWDTQKSGPLFTTVPGVIVGAPVSAAPGDRVLVSSPTGVAVYDPSDGIKDDLRFATSDTPIAGIVASADGTRFVVVYGDGRLELRDTASGDFLFDFERRVHSAADNPSFTVPRRTVITLDRRGTHVAYQDAKKQIEVVDDKGTTIDTINLSLQRSELQALGLNDDGSELVVSTTSGDALWYDERGIDAEPLVLQGTGFDAQFVSHHRIATIGGGGAQIIDPRSGQTTKLLDVAKDVTRLAVDGTGRLLATADSTGSIQLWDAATATQIGGVLHIRNLQSAEPMRFSADGHYLLVSGPDETTWINVRTADWPGIACDLVTEQLSPTERALGSLGKSGPCP
jgi:WD40 repeat protein